MITCLLWETMGEYSVQPLNSQVSESNSVIFFPLSALVSAVQEPLNALEKDVSKRKENLDR